MIYINLYKEEKLRVIKKHVANKKIVFISPKSDFIDLGEDVYYINYSEVICYKYYNKLLQELSKNHLLILNECLRSKDSSLYNNCLRLYANQSGKVLYFNTFPIIDTTRDFLTIVNVATGTKSKYLAIDNVSENIIYRQTIPKFNVENIQLSEEDLKKHETFKNKIIDEFDFTKKPSTILTKIQKNLTKIKKKYNENLCFLEVPQHNIKLIEKLKNTDITFLKSNAGFDSFVLEDKMKIIEEMEVVYESLSRNKRAKKIT